MKSEILESMKAVLIEYGSPEDMLSYSSIDHLMGHIRVWQLKTNSQPMLELLERYSGHNHPSTVLEVHDILSYIRRWYREESSK
jgi:hypothetical protein